MDIKEAQEVVGAWAARGNREQDALMTYLLAVIRLEELGARFLADYGISNVAETLASPDPLYHRKTKEQTGYNNSRLHNNLVNAAVAAFMNDYPPPKWLT